MSLDPGLSAAIARGRLEAGPREWPVAVLLTPIPLDLFAQVGTAIADALDDLGYRAQLREVTGVSVIWAVQVEGDLVELAPQTGDPPVSGGAGSAVNGKSSGDLGGQDEAVDVEPG